MTRNGLLWGKYYSVSREETQPVEHPMLVRPGKRLKSFETPLAAGLSK
jgi:hypothetical protein